MDCFNCMFWYIKTLSGYDGKLLIKTSIMDVYFYFSIFLQ